MKLIGHEDSKKEPVLITPFSLGHFVAGGILSKCVNFFTAELLHFAYEIPLFLDDTSSIAHDIGDQLFFTVGYLLFK